MGPSLNDGVLASKEGRMGFFIGVGVVLGCVMGGYIMGGGHIAVLWQPTEFIIILGAAIGGVVIKGLMGRASKLFKGPHYKKAAYVELLVLLNSVFKLAKMKGAMALEQHI